MWYYFCYSIYGLRLIDIENNEDKEKDRLDWKKGFGMAFSIIFALCSINFAFAFKDLVIIIMNIISLFIFWD